MTVRIGLTGSIGMGKSTTAQMFRDLGCDVWDADAAVHRLYSAEGAAVPLIAEQWPHAVVNGAVSRDVLKDIISSDPLALGKIEQIVHPLVREDREAFSNRSTADFVVFDIPLLFETGAEDEFDATVCVDVAPEIQRARVLARGTMTQEQFEHILSKQMPNEDKKKRSDFVVRTETLETARDDVKTVLETLKNRL